MLKISLYDFDRTIYPKDTGTRLYIFLFRKYPLLLMYIPVFLGALMLYSLKMIKSTTWKNIMIRPMCHFSLTEWRSLVREFWEIAHKNFFPQVLEHMEKEKKSGHIIGIISASLEFYLEPLDEILQPNFIIGTKVHTQGEKILGRLDGANCKEEEKVQRFRFYMENYYPEQEYEVVNMVSDSLHDLPLYKIAKHCWTVENDGTLREGLPKAYSNDVSIH